MNKYDIAVIGGGMVGAAVAVGFAKQGRSVVLVEGTKPKVFDAAQAMDIRVSAISHQSVELLDSLGAWSEIK
ncbi:FAD-dependent oxidoreductase, partial [Vibrio alginolyticus]